MPYRSAAGTQGRSCLRLQPSGDEGAAGGLSWVAGRRQWGESPGVVGCGAEASKLSGSSASTRQPLSRNSRPLRQSNKMAQVGGDFGGQLAPAPRWIVSDALPTGARQTPRDSLADTLAVTRGCPGDAQHQRLRGVVLTTAPEAESLAIPKLTSVNSAPSLHLTVAGDGLGDRDRRCTACTNSADRALGLMASV